MKPKIQFVVEDPNGSLSTFILLNSVVESIWVIHSMLKTFSDVKKFLERADFPPATSTKLLQVLDDPAKTRKLKIEIATTVDAMEPFISHIQARR